MKRRAYLGALGATGTAGVAGCLGDLPVVGDDGRTVLEPPEQDLSEASHPSYDDEFPSVQVPDPIRGEEISTTQFEGERSVLMTFFYASCPDGVCPALLLRLRRAQAVAAEQGFGGDVAFLAMTFDPERDTADVLQTHGEEHGVDFDAGNWHFLRPEGYEAAEGIVTGEFGLPLEKQPADDYENLDYMFPHYSYIFLVNEQGIIERVYPNGATIEVERVTSDLETVVTA